MSRLLMLALLALTAASCAAPQLSDMTSWQGCLIQPGLSDDPSSRGPLTAGGATQTLYASFNQPNRYATLRLEMPGSLPRGKAVYVGGDEDSDWTARYQQGDTMQTYDSTSVKGTVKVIEFDGQKATLDIDFTVTAPVVDTTQSGDIKLKGRLEMERVRNIHSCYGRP